MMPKIIKSFARFPFTSVLSVAFWLLIWEAAALLLSQPLFLPTPVAVFSAMGTVFGNSEAWVYILLSLARVTVGFLEGLLAGMLLAFLSYRFRIVDKLFSPIVTTVRATPVASFIMLLWLVAGATRLPSLIAALMVFPIVYAGFLASLRNLSPELSEVCRLYKIPLAKRLQIYYIPSVMPTFSATVINAFGLAWKAGIAAEVLAQTSLSIGKEIYLAKSYLEVEALYAWTVVVIVASLLLEALVRLVFKRFTKGGKRNGAM